MKVEFYKHNIGSREIRDINRVLRGLFLTTGKEVELFERIFAEHLGQPYAVGVTSCTAAIQIALTALGVSQGDEVITTPLSFAATATAIVQAGARPVFVDVEPGTGNIDVELIERAITARTRAIVPVHLYGQLCDMLSLRKLADRNNLVIVEDAAHAVEASRRGVRTGDLGEASCFSFYATKSITCGEGGAVAVRDAVLADKLKALRHHGMTSIAAERYEKSETTYRIDSLGWKYNMDNIQAALLLGQVERIAQLHLRRSRLAAKYRKSLEDVPGIELMAEIPDSVHANHLFVILVPPDRRNEFISRMRERGIGVSINYIPIHLYNYFQDTFGFSKGMFPVAEEFGERVVSLPLYPKLKSFEVDYVVNSIREIAAEIKLDY